MVPCPLLPCPLLPCPLPTPRPLHCPALPRHEDKILPMPFLQEAFGFAPSWERLGPGSLTFQDWAQRPHAPCDCPLLSQQSYGEGPHYGEHRELPSHNSISSSPFLGAGLVGECLQLPASPQGRARVALAGPCWGERWDSLAAPCAGAAPGVLQAVVQGGGVQRVPSVPAVPAVLCVWLFPCFVVAPRGSSRDRCPLRWAECAPGSWESGAGEMLIVKGLLRTWNDPA